MDKEILDKYIKAGRIADTVHKECKNFVRPGSLLLDIAQKVEDRIKELGGEIAFPVNLSLNEIAAHYTPFRGDDTIVSDDDVLKVDIGVHVDGYVADTGRTLCFNKDYDNMVKASDKALDEALKLCKPGAKLSEISSVIEDSIKSFGYVPVANLSGHGLDKFVLHTDPQILNIKVDSSIELKEDMVIAVEPFATNGQGLVKESGNAMIFSFVQSKPVRNAEARKIIEFTEPFGNLPFAERWIPIESRVKIRFALRELLSRGVLHDYPPLKEAASGIVTQSEHTVIIKDKPIITTG